MLTCPRRSWSRCIHSRRCRWRKTGSSSRDTPGRCQAGDRYRPSRQRASRYNAAKRQPLEPEHGNWARFRRKHISIFVSTHTWRGGTISQDQIAQTIEQGDDSTCKIPGVLFYAQGMPVVVNKNIYTGLKVVNGAEFTAVDIIPDPNYPGYYLTDDVTIHFGPPLGILLHSADTKSFSHSDPPTTNSPHSTYLAYARPNPP